MPNLFAMLDAAHPSAAACARALLLSRQAYQQARARRRLSDRAAIRAAAILNIDPGRALLINATADNPPAPVIDTPQNLPAELHISTGNNTNYAFKDRAKKADKAASKMIRIHSITSQKQNEAVDLIRWVYAVAGIRADSPRFDYYVSRWKVPNKIARAKSDGTFDDLAKNCPPIDPAWARLVPAALDAFRTFTAEHHLDDLSSPASSSIAAPPRNRSHRF